MRIYILLAVVSISTMSCYHVYYSPNTANAPLLSQKGETRINGLYASGNNSEFEGGEVQLATAVSKNVGVMINGMFVGKTEMVSDYGGGYDHPESGKGSYVELAGGMFKAFDEKSRWIGEAFAGAGVGTANNTYEQNLSSQVGIFKFFLQPAMGYKTKNFEAVLVPKISFVNWKVKRDELIGTDQNHPDYSDEMDLNSIRQKPNFLCFEPALIIRAGGENVKLQGALSFSNFNRDVYAIEQLNASIGVSVNLFPRKK